MPGTLKRLATDNGSVSPPPTKRKAQGSVSNAAVANFFTPISQKEPEKTSWRMIDNSLLVCKYDKPDEFAGQKPRKIAAFDFDSTLIVAASGKKFSHDANDWKWWHHSVPARLQELASEGYLVTILSNQGGISLATDSKSLKSDKKRLTEFKSKVNNVLRQLDLPITLYAATAKDLFRKPRTGMWDMLLKEHGINADDVDIKSSYFVGDAGGRTASTSGPTKADFSCSDRNMASNVGISFKTPEEFFLAEEARPFARDFEPLSYLEAVVTAEADKPTTANGVFTKKHPVDIVMFCGSPGAGKSTYFWKQLKPLGYERVNQDTLKTRDRCIQAAKSFLQDGISVAVDNTNADVETRAHWIKLAQSFNVPIRCAHFTASTKLCEHNDTVRALGSAAVNPEARTMLPKVAFTGFAARYRKPTIKEGFEDITQVDFKFNGSDDQRALWSRYWV